MAFKKLSKLILSAAALAIFFASVAPFSVLADDGSNPAEQPHGIITTGVYVKDGFSLTVVQQPYSSFVSTEADTITQFGMAAQFGNIGLLAHNYLAGEKFFDLEIGQQIYVFHGTESVEIFVVTEIIEYQAISPNSPYSDFTDLATGSTLNANDLFHKVYKGDRHITFQTCIEKDGELSWGRLFVIAVPLATIQAEAEAAALAETSGE
jgi:hypothetical protein